MEENSNFNSKFMVEWLDVIRVHRQAKFAESKILCFQYLGFHDHTFNRAKLANYVISPGFHGFCRGFQ